MSEHLLHHWKAYRKEVMSEDASRVQVEETRNAFYAGAAMVTMTLERVAEPDISETQAVEILESMKREIQDFHKKHAMKHGLTSRST